MSSSPASSTHPLTKEQAATLRQILQRDGFEFQSKPYTLYAARKGKLTVAVYEKGPKVLVQGRDTADFVQFTLEPEVLGEATIGYDEVHHPDWFQPHFGIDESGKGDFFGPLVIAGFYTDEATTHRLQELGVTDSKKISSDRKIAMLAGEIRKLPGAVFDVIRIGPTRYNEMYARFGNLNRLLAWGHARVILNLLEMQPDCPRALSDQFARVDVLKRALGEQAGAMVLDQRTKAESDPAVAAASILARDAFVGWLEKAAERLGLDPKTGLPKGASARVRQVADTLVRERGAGFLTEVAKVHFKTAREWLP